MNKGQKQWRHGYMTGAKRASGIDESLDASFVSSDELNKLRRDSALLGIMKNMGVFTEGSGQYWYGTEQAFLLLDDYFD